MKHKFIAVQYMFVGFPGVRLLNETAVNWKTRPQLIVKVNWKTKFGGT